MKKHDLEKSRVLYEVSRVSSGSLPEKLQKQVFDFLVAFELAQIRCETLSVEAQLFRQCGCSLRFFCPHFPPCGVDCLLIRCWRRALCLDERHCLFVQCVALDPAHFNERYARKFADNVLHAAEQLSDFPELGVLKYDTLMGKHSFRALFIDQYVCIYKIETDAVYIYHFADARKNYIYHIFGME